jgi:hypothetical protein
MVITFSSVMTKLKAAADFPGYPNFIRHINGNTLDNRASNLTIVTLREAFNNIATWKVDWVCYVTEEDVAFLKNLLIPRS